MKNPPYLLLILKIKTISIALILMSCNSKTSIDIQGHRGARGLYPENSLLAFEKAIDLGVTTLELDIAITSDKRVVVSHEPYMNATICLKPNGTPMAASEGKYFNLYGMTHDEIKTFDCGSKPHPKFPEQRNQKVYKPLLKEVFELVKAKKSNVNFNIEIKSKPQYYGTYTPYPKDYVAIVLDEIYAEQITVKRITLQSFDIAILEEIHQQDPDLSIALLVDENETIATKLNQLTFQPSIISPYYKLLTQALVTHMQHSGFKVIPWTVNTTEAIEQMLAFGVNGIITDYPDRLIKR